VESYWRWLDEAPAGGGVLLLLPPSFLPLLSLFWWLAAADWEKMALVLGLPAAARGFISGH